MPSKLQLYSQMADDAARQVLRHYEPYISKLCTRKLYDEYGGAHHCLDEYMKRHLEIKLITAILNSMEFE